MWRGVCMCIYRDGSEVVGQWLLASNEGQRQISWLKEAKKNDLSISVDSLDG